MSSKPPPLPNAAARRARLATPPSRTRPLPEAEFLSDEFVEDDTASAASEPPDPRHESSVGFVGPSDAPPARLSWPAAREAPAQSALRRPRSPWVAIATAGAVGFFVGRQTVAPGPAAPGAGTVTVSAVDPSGGIAPTKDPPGAAAPVASEAPPAAASPAASSSEPAPPSEALATRDAAQQALEGGKVRRAIELGEHAVDLDPTDADAWLILGAAYLQRGANKDAKRCFASCVEQATHGAKSECEALLR